MQYELTNNTLQLNVKSSSLFARGVLLFFVICFFTFPLIAIAMSASEGRGLRFGLIMQAFILGLLGAYFFRLYAWNSFGKEIIEINGNEISYEADYKFLKGAKKTETVTNLSFSFECIGYEDDNIGTLVIGDKKICSVVKMPIKELEALISLLNQKYPGV